MPESSKISNAIRPRVLIVSHGHPNINPGGGEIAAFNLYEELNRRGDFDAYYFARHKKKELLHGGTGFSGTGNNQEILFYAEMPDWFKFSQPDKAKVWRDFAETLALVKPDIVHFHHYLHIGIEMLRMVKNHDNRIPVVLTLHEYFGICHNHGQMIKTYDRSLCQKSSPADCSQCFPDKTPQDFFLRKQFIQSYFSLVDRFISPSEFLKKRYTDWGLQAEKISVIENVDFIECRSTVTSLEELTGGNSTNSNQATLDKNRPVRFAYFGQINAFKGVDLLCEAFNQLPGQLKKVATLDINGSGLEHQPSSLQDRIRYFVETSKGRIRMKGRYAPSELAELMDATDWVVVPSRWWENSPMVILEARKHGKPIVGCNIGGVAEKITHGRDGLLFQNGRADSLAETMQRIIENPVLAAEFGAESAKKFAPEAAMQSHLDVYQRLLSNAGNGSDSIGGVCSTAESDAKSALTLDGMSAAKSDIAA